MLLSLLQFKRKPQSKLATCAQSFSEYYFVLLSSIQRGKDEYKLAASSDGGDKKTKKDQAKRDMDDLKKEVDLVSTHKIHLRDIYAALTTQTHLVLTLDHRQV